jgi:hypothetical protein
MQRCSATCAPRRYSSLLALLIQKYAAELQDENAALQRSLRVAQRYSSSLQVALLVQKYKY